MLRRAVFLDRDGVINRQMVRGGKPYPPEKLSDFEYLPGAVKGIRELRNAGYLIIVVTNQPDVATGLQSKKVVQSMHDKLKVDQLCDEVKVCYHTDDDNCACRKPKPGMIIEAAVDWGIDLKASFMIGDRWRDIEAGESAGCFTFFIDYQYQERRPEKPDAIVGSLDQAAEYIIHQI